MNRRKTTWNWQQFTTYTKNNDFGRIP